MGAGHSSSNTCYQIQKDEPPTIASHKSSYHGQTDVSMSIARHVSSTEGKQTNMVLCPLLIQLVLTSIAAGSNGPTRQQILRFLRSESVEDLNRMSSNLATLTFSDGCTFGGPKLCFVNSVWVDKSLCLKQSFMHVLDNAHKASLKHVDFRTKVAEVTREVNSWAKNNTNGLIEELIPPNSIDANTRLIFANALYFKGTWVSKFDHSRTFEADFNLLHGGSVKVPFMTSNSKQFITTFNNFKVLRLCYEKGRDTRQFSMYIFLPNTKDGLPSLLRNISSESDFLERHIPQVRVGVNKFMIPRFKVSFEIEASNTLKQLSLTLPFTSPDLSEMFESGGDRNLFVSRIFHKAFIEVNEEGTEAAAASAGVVATRSLSYQQNTVDFVADHPFLFFVREDISGSVLFIGHVMNPHMSC